MKLAIAFASDARYFHGLALALASVLRNSTGLDNAAIHILDGGLTPGQKDTLRRMVERNNLGIGLKFHGLDLDQFCGVRLFNRSALTYARLLLPELLPDLDEILYLDADIMYGEDLGKVWAIDLKEAAVAAVRDANIRTLGQDCPWLQPGAPDAGEPYFNAGVMKINLAYWRTHKVGSIALGIARNESEKCRYFDQSVLNYILRDAVYWLPDTFNTQDSLEHPLSPDIELNTRNIHYVSLRKPWRQHSSRMTFRHWRSHYFSLVSKWPVYMCSCRYWAPYLGRECLEGSRLYIILLRILLVSGLHRLIPDLPESKLRDYLREAQNGFERSKTY